MSMEHESAFLNALVKLGAPAPDPTVVVETTSKDEENGTTNVPDPGGVTVSNIWRHPDAHPITLDLMLIKKYGPEWLLLEPETLQEIVPQDFKTQSLSDLNLSKLQACKTLHATETFWERWEVFVWCTMPLNGEYPDFEMMQVPTIAQALVAVDCANRIQDDVKWSVEVEKYLEQLHLHEGILLPIPPLDFVKVDTSSIDVDMEDVRRRWPAIRGGARPPAGDTLEDEQLRRLLQVHEFLEASRDRLRVQLAMVAHV
jgi:hypothetical protein